ncbi:hypothetical protein [Sphingobium chungbukense]|uniref:hypothetical protein n=1 Tax=Sphingobium chungbukense TaxID=56193 RepID=UPI0018DCFFCF|nr:hypothetical protein [Sphingobium chungbukense]
MSTLMHPQLPWQGVQISRIVKIIDRNVEMVRNETAWRDAPSLIDEQEGFRHPAIGDGERSPSHHIRDPFEITRPSDEDRADAVKFRTQRRHQPGQQSDIVGTEAMARVEFGPVPPTQLIEEAVRQSGKGDRDHGRNRTLYAHFRECGQKCRAGQGLRAIGHQGHEKLSLMRGPAQ